MALPAQAERDLQEVEELERQLAAQNKQPEPEEANLETEQVEETAEAEQEPDSDESEAVEAIEPDFDVKAQESEDFKQKYNSLRGKYDAEVPRLHAQVKELAQQLEQLQQAKQEPEPDPEPKTYVTDADREEYGEDLLDVQRRVAQEVGSQYETKISKLEKVIEQLQTELHNTGGQITEMTFEQRLHRLVPDFEAVNKDPKWIAWLDQVDPIIRGPRRNMAQQAFATGDAEAVADYVRMFRDTLNPPEKVDTNAELEKQVTPNRNNTAKTPVATNEKPTYTEAEMDRTWDQITELNKAGRYDEADKLEAEISAALVEGRVQLTR